MIRSSNNEIKRAVSKSKTLTVPAQTNQPIAVPFSATGITAVLACPVLLCLDIFSSGYTFLGVVFVILLALLSNERRTLVALFATVATVTLLIDLRLVYGQPGAELAVMDKFLALVALPVLAYTLIRQRTTQVKIQKHKKVCNMAVILPLNERIAMRGETRSVFHHICRYHGPMDEYTRELIWFVYLKSPKN